jgi:hypothetical protein
VSLCFWSSGLGSLFLVEGSVFEHGEDDVAAAPGEADDGGVVFRALGAFPVVVGLGRRVVAGGIQADRKSAFLSCLLPERAGKSPRREVPERRVTGAMPA